MDSAERKAIPFASTTLGPFTGLLAAPRDGFRRVFGWRPPPGSKEAARLGGLGWLVPNDTDGVLYLERYPALRAERCRDLHRRFARLARVPPERQDAAILKFADRFGFLGSADDRCPLTPPDPTDRPGVWSYSETTRDGEPWRLWTDAIPEVAALVALWDLLQRGERGRLDRFLTWSRTPPRSVALQVGWNRGRLLAPPVPFDVEWRDRTYGGVGATIADERTAFGAYRFRQHPRMDTFDAVRLYLHDKVNAKLRGQVSPRLYDERRPGGELMFVPHTLLAAIYLHFAREMMGEGYPTTPCANPRCGRPFVPQRSNQRYCTTSCKSLAGYHRSRQAPR